VGPIAPIPDRIGAATSQGIRTLVGGTAPGPLPTGVVPFVPGPPVERTTTVPLSPVSQADDPMINAVPARTWDDYNRWHRGDKTGYPGVTYLLTPGATPTTFLPPGDDINVPLSTPPAPVVSDTDTPSEDNDMAIDWGDAWDIAKTIADYALGPLYDPPGIGGNLPVATAPQMTIPGGGAAPMPAPGAPAFTGAPPSANGIPKGYVFDPHTGRWIKRRRRRKRLLTESDYNDLMRIQTLSNSKNVQIALAKAIGR